MNIYTTGNANPRKCASETKPTLPLTSSAARSSDIGTSPDRDADDQTIEYYFGRISDKRRQAA